MDPLTQLNSLASCLGGLAGVPGHQFDPDDVRVSSLSPALLAGKDKDRFRMLEAVGDCALSLAVAQRSLDLRLSAQRYQDARSHVTSTGVLSELFVESGLSQCVTFVAGVTPRGRVGAGGLEVCIGLVYRELGMSGVVVFCENVGVFDRRPHW